MGQEEGVRSGADSLVGVAAHQTEVFEPLCDEAAHGHVDVPPAHAGAGGGEGEVVGIDYNIIYVLLPLRVTAADGRGARVVGAIVVNRFGTGVAEQEASGLKGARRGIAMEDFTMHGHDTLERGQATIGGGDAVEHAADVLLRHAGAAQAHGGGVHLIAYGSSTFEFLDLLFTLHEAQLHHGIDERRGGFLTLLGGVDAEEVHNLDLRVVAVGRQEMHGAPLSTGLADEFCQTAHGRRRAHAAFGRHGLH